MSILTHITLGTADLGRAKTFYDEVLAPLHYKRLIDIEGRICGWGIDAPQFLVGLPRNGEAATPSNGFTIGLAAPNRAAVDEFHARAIALGATDEGAPGPRPFGKDAYAAYIRDPDGNKVMANWRTPE